MFLNMCLYSPHRQNDYGQIGCGSNENVAVPLFVDCLDHVSKVTCGENHNLVLTGTVICKAGIITFSQNAIIKQMIIKISAFFKNATVC